MDQSTTIVQIHIEKPFVFQGVDFKRWQQKMLFYLMTLNLARCLTSEGPELLVEGDIFLMKSLKLQRHGRKTSFVQEIYILNALDDSFYDVYHIIQTSKQLWEAFEKKYKSEVASIKTHSWESS